LLARRFTRPIESLARAEAALAAGDWRARAPVPARDEIGRLAVTFNRMAAELQRSHEELERRVEERTAELVRSREALGGSERRLQSILDNTTAVIYVKDVEGRYLLSNREHENLFKIRRAEVQGKTDADIFPAEIAAAFRANDVKVIQGGEALEFEEIAPGSDGPHTYISIKFPLRDAEDRIYAVCGISTDITERKRAERELIRAKAELERSNRDLDRFASVASHDLQEPARMVGSYCELLVKRCGGKLDEESEKYLHHAADGAERMQRMVRDLLAYARLGSRGGLIAPTESGGALDRALANLAQAIEESGAEVTRGEMPRVRADGAQLTQVFQNLIGNSIRFRSEAPPRISVIAERVDGDWVFRVSDNGIGMDARDTERIFGVFQRLHGRRRYPGSGIGLAICRRAIERLGGRIWAESTPGRGSVFHFTIPAELAPPEAPADAARPPSAAIGG
jgi:PAS domain S-box-containing protein